MSDVDALLHNMQAFADAALTNATSAYTTALDFANDSGETIDVPSLSSNIDSATPSIGQFPTLDAQYTASAVAPRGLAIGGVGGAGITVPVAPTLSLTSVSDLTLPDLQAMSLVPPTAPVVSFGSVDSLLSAIATIKATEFSLPDLQAPNSLSAPAVAVPILVVDALPAPPDAPDNLTTVFSESRSGEYGKMAVDLNARYAAFKSGEFPKIDESFSALTKALDSVLSPESSEDPVFGSEIAARTSENAAYQRARARAEAEFSRAASDATAAAKKRGFVMPPASMTSALATASLQAARSNAAQAGEIAIARLNKLADVRVHTIDTMLAVQQFVRNSLMAYLQLLVPLNEQATLAAKEILSATMQVFGAKMEVYRLQFDVMRLKVEIFGAELKAALAAVDIFRAEIEANKAILETNALALDAYGKSIEAERMKVDIAVASIQAIATAAGVEKTKADVFSSQVAAYAAQVGADETRAKIFATLLQRDEIAVKQELAKVEVFSAQVEAAKAQAQISVANTDAAAKSQANMVEAYKAEVEAFRTQSTVEVDAFKTELERERAILDAYKASKELEVEVYKAQLQGELAKLEAQKVELDATVKVAAVNTERTLGFAKLGVDAATAMAQSYGSVAQGALTGINGMMSKVVQTSE